MKRIKTLKEHYFDKRGIDILPQIETAAKDKAQYFVTSNKEVLEDRKLIEDKYPIKIRTSKEWIREAGAQHGRQKK